MNHGVGLRETIWKGNTHTHMYNIIIYIYIYGNNAMLVFKPESMIFLEIVASIDLGMRPRVGSRFQDICRNP